MTAKPNKTVATKLWKFVFVPAVISGLVVFGAPAFLFTYVGPPAHTTWLVFGWAYSLAPAAILYSLFGWTWRDLGVPLPWAQLIAAWVLDTLTLGLLSACLLGAYNKLTRNLVRKHVAV